MESLVQIDQEQLIFNKEHRTDFHLSLDKFITISYRFKMRLMYPFINVLFKIFFLNLKNLISYP